MTAGESTAPVGERFRPDIQALRAIAVAAVLLYHLWPNRLTGGFVGVDVFFVISGFLITSHLLNELTRTGRIAAGRFWARRAKRLLPASLLVLAAVAVAVIVWVPRSLWPQFLAEVAASALYVQNWFLAASSVDYSAADNLSSPVQHFWTLSVEEQFYIALPIIVLLIVLCVRSHPDRARRAVLATIAVLTAASFAYGVWFTGWSGSAAYFSTLTRAWEFGVGALLVLLPRIASRLAASVTTAAGLVMIAAAAVFFDAEVPFPGVAAALPVVGTALVLWTGAPTFAAWLGRLAPVSLLGRISYAVYLWHWPLIVLLPYASGRPLSTLDKVGILIVTLVLAWVSTTQWEDRVRFSPRLLGRASPRAVLAWSAAGMALVIAVPVATLAIDGADRARTAEITAQIAEAPPECFGAQAIVEGCAPTGRGEMLVPAPADANADDGNRSECWAGDASPELKLCSVGPQSDYDAVLLAVGDSHNNSLVGAYEKIAQARNWRIDIAGRGGCYWTEAPLLRSTDELTEGCEGWRSALAAHIRESDDLDAIITIKARRPLASEVAAAPGQDPYELIVDGMADAWNARPDHRVPVLVVIDNPALPTTIGTCVEAAPEDAERACAVPRSDALPREGAADAAVRTENAHVIDLTDLYCTLDECSPVIGGVVVYRDGRHLTATYALTVAPYLGERLDAVLRASPPTN